MEFINEKKENNFQEMTKESLSLILKSYVNAGLSPIPVDVKTKCPLIERWQEQHTTIEDIDIWINKGYLAFGIVCGEPSSGLEILDSDDYHLPGSFEKWKKLLPVEASIILETLPITQTQHGGFHVLYRTNIIEGNKKLAQRPYDITLDGEPKHNERCGPNCNSGDFCKAKNRQTFIETRGKGGQALEPPSPGYTLTQGDLTNIPLIDDEIRETFFRVARSLSLIEEKKDTTPGVFKNNLEQSRPGDDFNTKGTWESILIPHGWKKCGTSDETTLWTRPGKTWGISATTNHYGTDQLYVFSTNAYPFESEKSYNKFAGHALLNFNGDFNAAAKGLVEQHYSDKNTTNEIKMEILSWREFSKKDFLEARWRIQNLIPLEGFVILSAISGEKKTWVSLDMGRCISQGINFLGTEIFKTEQAKILYVDQENPERDLVRRGKQLGIVKENDSFFLYRPDSLNLNDEKVAKKFLEFILENDFKVIFIDTLRAVAGGLKEDKAEDIRMFFNRFKVLKDKGIVVVFLDHSRKPQNFEGKTPKKEQLLGSQDKTASVEVLIQLSSKSGTNEIRVYQSKNRLDREIDPFKILMKDSETEDGARTTSLIYDGKIEEDETKKDEAKEYILELLKEGSKTTKEIIDGLSAQRIGERNARSALKDLTVEEKIDVGKQGKQNLYFLVQEVSNEPKNIDDLGIF